MFLVILSPSRDVSSVRSVLVFLTGHKTPWIKFGNCLGLRRCSDNSSNISPFSSNHRYLSVSPLKWCMYVRVCVCVCVCELLTEMQPTKPGWSSLHAQENIYVGFIFHGIIASTLLCGSGLWKHSKHALPPLHSRRTVCLTSSDGAQRLALLLHGSSISYLQGATLETVNMGSQQPRLITWISCLTVKKIKIKK